MESFLIKGVVKIIQILVGYYECEALLGLLSTVFTIRTWLINTLLPAFPMQPLLSEILLHRIQDAGFPKAFLND